jgi:hypothetical protein
MSAPMPMLRIRLGVPLNLFLNAKDPDQPRSINRDFHMREAQFIAMGVQGYGESDQEQR